VGTWCGASILFIFAPACLTSFGPQLSYIVFGAGAAAIVVLLTLAIAAQKSACVRHGGQLQLSCIFYSPKHTYAHSRRYFFRVDFQRHSVMKKKAGNTCTQPLDFCTRIN
jgi:hypothetical protein